MRKPHQQIASFNMLAIKYSHFRFWMSTVMLMTVSLIIAGFLRVVSQMLIKLFW